MGKSKRPTVQEIYYPEEEKLSEAKRPTVQEIYYPKMEPKAMPPTVQEVYYPSEEKTEEEKLAESKEFYKEEGYPEYAGKYEPFETPEGYTVKEVTEGKEGLEVVFEPTPRMKGLAERIAEFDPYRYGAELGAQIFGLTDEERERRISQFMAITKPVRKATVAVPLGDPKFLAGAIAPAEALAYTVGTLAGLETPRPPPTVLGGVITSGIGLALTREVTVSEELKRAAELGEMYMAATIMGDIVVSWAVGKATHKFIIEPIAKTRVGRYVGYQFKVHAPKPLLKVVYGKKGAEYIVQERLPYTISKTQMITPSGKVLIQTFKVPKSVQEVGEAYLRDILMPTGARAKTDFPLVVTRGKTITPMKTTLSKAIKAGLREKKGVTTLLAPLRTMEVAKHILTPKLPALAQTLQFGVTPITKTIPTGVAAAGVLIAKTKITIRKPKTISRQRPRPLQILRPRDLQIPSVDTAQQSAIAQQSLSQAIAGTKQQLRQSQKALPLLALASRQQLVQVQQQVMKIPQIQRYPIERRQLVRDLPQIPSLAKWFYKKHPVATGKQVAAHIFSGLPKKKRRRKK